MTQAGAYQACVQGLSRQEHPEVLGEKYGQYTLWMAQRIIEAGGVSDLDSIQEMRRRVTSRLLYEGEMGDEPHVRVQALSKVLASCDQRELSAAKLAVAMNKHDATEEDVRAELRNPTPRLIELMIDEWTNGGQVVAIGLDGQQVRPPIAELVRALLPHWEDLLEEEGYVRRCER